MDLPLHVELSVRRVRALPEPLRWDRLTPIAARSEMHLAHPKPEEIKAARHAAGLGQAQAAELVCASLTAWRDYEQDRRRLHPGLWQLFLDRLEKR
jgi:hypothetical protein